MFPKTSPNKIPVKFLFLFGIIVFTLMCITGDTPTLAQAVSRGGERGSFILNWDGVWDTTYGTLELAQDGTSIIGRYGTEGGMLTGDLDGRTLIFDWFIDPDLSATPAGQGEFTLNSDNGGFTGWYQYASSPQEYDWIGTRKSDRVIDERQADVDYCLWTGAWEIPGGMIIFDQQMDSPAVRGEFAGPDLAGTFEGEASGWSLEITWESDSTLGTGHLTMSDSLGSFAGSLISEDPEIETVITGTFASFDLRTDFSGLWQTGWGLMEINQDEASGIINGTIADAVIGGRSGSCMISGTVLGPTLTIIWVLQTSDGSYDGTALLNLDSENSRLSGKWSSAGLNLTDEKFSGTRR